MELPWFAFFQAVCIMSGVSSVVVATTKDIGQYNFPHSRNSGGFQNVLTMRVAQQSSGSGNWHNTHKETSKAVSTLSGQLCKMPSCCGRSSASPSLTSSKPEDSSTPLPGSDSTCDHHIVFFHVEIANKRIKNIPVWTDCQLSHLGEALGENESVRVLYYLYEKLQKESCNIEDADVMVRLRPNWKCISMKDLVDDTSATLEEVFGEMLSVNGITLCLVPPEKCHHSVTRQKVGLDDATQRDVKQRFGDLFSRYTIQDLVDSNCPFSMDFILDVYRGRYSILSSVTNEQHKQFTNWLTTLQTKKITPEPQSFKPEVLPPRRREEGSLSRSRAIFDPITEIPLLKSWFEGDERPENDQIARYTAQLNLARPTKRSLPLEEKSVRIWFKNARAKKARLAQTGQQGK